MKKFLIFFLVLFLAQNSFAQDSESYSDFLDFRKKIIETKNDTWKLNRKTKEISKAQKWTKDQIQPRLLEIKEFESALKKFQTDFKSFGSELSEELNELSKKVSERSQEIDDIFALQNEISKEIANSRKLALIARNKTRELLAIQTNTESAYRNKYKSDFPQTAIDIVENRIRTQQKLSDIFQVTNDIDEIEQKHLLGYSFIPQDIEDFYDPKIILENIQTIKNSLEERIKDCNKDIKENNIRMRAVLSL
jgi:chromosome segregation ATPase